jgi:maltose O-acetyltransferase
MGSIAALIPVQVKHLLERFLIRCLPLDTAFAVLYERYQRRVITSLHRRLGIPPSVALRYPVRIEGNVHIGDGTYVNPYTEIESGPNSQVRIGRNCAIARFVCIRAITHDLSNGTGPEMQFVEKDIVIGDHVWIGTQAFIKEGVSIGDHAVIAAHAVVTKDVPAYAVVAGVPARVLRYLDPALEKPVYESTPSA